jgi:hypothetical protein
LDAEGLSANAEGLSANAKQSDQPFFNDVANFNAPTFNAYM